MDFFLGLVLLLLIRCGGITGYADIIASVSLQDNTRYTKSGWAKMEGWQAPVESGHYISGVLLENRSSEIKAPLAGMYVVFAAVTLTGANDGQFTVSVVSNNKVEQSHRALASSYQGNPQGSYTLSVRGTILLTKNDVVSLYVHSSKDEDWTVMGYSQSTFSLKFVSLFGRVPGFSSVLKSAVEYDTPGVKTLRHWMVTGSPWVFRSMTGFSADVGEFSAMCEGVFFISASARIQTTGSSKFVLWISVNNASTADSIQTASSPVFTMSLSTVLLLKKGEIVTVNIQRKEGSAMFTVTQESGFFGVLVGKTSELQGGLSSFSLGDQTGSAGDWITLTINAPNGTENGQFGGPTELQEGRFVPTKDGVYLITVTLLVESASNVIGALVSSHQPLSSFSSSIKGLFGINAKPQDDGQISFSIAGLVKLAPSEPLVLYLYTQNSGKYTVKSGSRYAFTMINPGYSSSHLEMSGQESLTADNVWVEIKKWTFNGGFGTYSLSSTQLMSSSGRYAIVSDGIYFVSCNIVLEDAGGAISVLISVNGEQSKRKGLFATNGNPTGKETLHASGTLHLVNGDYISVFVKASGSSSWAAGSKSTFSVSFLGIPIFVSGFSTVLSSRVTISSPWTQLQGWLSTFEGPHFSQGTSFNPTTGLYVVPVTGLYIVTANLKLEDASTKGSKYVMTVSVNGNPSSATYYSALTDYIVRANSPPASNDFFSMNIGGTLNLQRGDEVTLWIKGEGDSAWSISEDSSFSLVLISELPNPVASAVHAVLDQSISQTVSDATSWKKIRHWKTSKRDKEIGPFGINVVGDGPDGTFTITTSGVYLVFGVICLKDAAGTFEAAVFYDSNPGSLYAISDNSGTASYTMKLFGLLHVSSGKKLSLQVKSPKKNWEQDVTCTGWSILRMPHFEIPSYLSAGLGSVANVMLNFNLTLKVSMWRTDESTNQQETGSGLLSFEGIYIVPSNGTYLVTAQVHMGKIVSPSKVILYIGINGDTSDTSRLPVLGPSTFTDNCRTNCTLMLTAVLVLTSHDTLGLYLRVNGSSTASVTSGLVSISFLSPSFPLPNGIYTQLSAKVPITVKGNSQITGWTTQSVPGSFQGDTGSLDDLNILHDGIYYIATTLQFEGIQGQTKSYIALRNIPALQSVRDNADDTPFALTVVGCMKISKNSVFTVTVYSDNDPSYTILETSSKTAVYLGDLNSVFGFSARPTASYTFISTAMVWQTLAAWTYSGKSWLFSSSLSLTDSSVLNVPASGTYLISANIIVRLAVNASAGNLELLLSVNENLDLKQHSLYQTMEAHPGKVVTLSITGQMYVERWSRLKLMLRFQQEAAMLIDQESSYSVVRLDSNAGNIPCEDYGPLLCGKLQPSNVRKGIGSDTEWICQATGSSLQYTWRKNFQAYAGAVQPKLSLVNLRQTDSAEYVCSVINNGVRASSNVGILVVYDPKPVFLNKAEDYQLRFKENGAENAILLNISARAQTQAEAYATMKFEIISGNINSIFAVTPEYSTHTVTLLRRRAFDREVTSEYTIVVRATNPGGNEMASQQIKIIVLDENDNKPAFQPSTYTASVMENATVGAAILQVVATDRDEISSEIQYSIPDLFTDTFSINASTGVITLIKQLDRESRDSYVLFVRATDGIYSTFTSVDIKVLDVNEFPPMFLKTSYNITVAESIDIKTPILKLDVMDKDSGQNARLLFQIPDGNVDGIFTVQEDGCLVSLKQLDYELHKSFQLTVSVQDRGQPPLRAEQNATVNVFLENTNDNRPHFEKSTYQVSVSENASIGTVVTVVKATDKDSDDQALTYQIQGGDGLFSVNSSSGAILLNGELDYEKKVEYSFKVMVSDNDNPPLTDLASVAVTILDYNDHRPEFNESTIFINVTESGKAEVEITTIRAFDRDSGINARLKYEVGKGDDDRTFIVDAFSGKLIAVKPLDREKHSFFQLSVFAIDLGDPPLSSDPPLTVKIFLLDENDNSPIFNPPSYVISVLESTAVGDTLLNMNVSDPDEGENGTIVLSVVEQDMKLLFGIDQNRKSLVLERPLDYETVISYQFTILARDKGIVPRETTAKVVLTVTNVNDNRPVFTQSHYKAYIPSMASSNITVFQVIASDMDLGPKGKLTYELVLNAYGDLFSMESDTGIVKTAKDLNTTDINLYNLKVAAKDSYVPPAISNITDLTVYITKRPQIVASNSNIGTSTITTSISTEGYAGLTVYKYEILLQEYHPDDEEFNEYSDLPPVNWYTVNILGSSAKNYIRRYRTIVIDLRNNVTRQRRALLLTNSIVVTVGSNTECPMPAKQEEVCNGALVSGRSYRLQLRGHTTDSEFPLDSHFTNPFTTASVEPPMPLLSDGSGGLLGLAVTFCISVSALLLSVIIVIRWRKSHQIINVDHLEERVDRARIYPSSKAPNISDDGGKYAEAFNRPYKNGLNGIEGSLWPQMSMAEQSQMFQRSHGILNPYESNGVRSPPRVSRGVYNQGLEEEDHWRVSDEENWQNASFNSRASVEEAKRKRRRPLRHLSSQRNEGDGVSMSSLDSVEETFLKRNRIKPQENMDPPLMLLPSLNKTENGNDSDTQMKPITEESGTEAETRFGNERQGSETEYNGDSSEFEEEL